MTMQKVHLDISSDIFDKVMFILENLPPNKVKYTIEKELQNIEKISDYNALQKKNPTQPKLYF